MPTSDAITGPLSEEVPTCWWVMSKKDVLTSIFFTFWCTVWVPDKLKVALDVIIQVATTRRRASRAL